jgi:hypothetical protein
MLIALITHARAASGRALLPVLEGLLAWGRTYAVSPTDPDLKRRRWAPIVEETA